MNQTEQILSQLHDVQLPPAPEGVSTWLILANLLALLLVALGLYHRWRRTRDRWRRDALSQVQQARSMEPAVAILSLAKLLRQILLYRHRDAPNDGRSWLVILDNEFSTHWFTQGDGQLFGSALYEPARTNDKELQLLCTELERLIRRLPARPCNAPSPDPRALS